MDTVSREQRAAHVVAFVGAMAIAVWLFGSVLLVLLVLVAGVTRLFIELQRTGKWR